MSTNKEIEKIAGGSGQRKIALSRLQDSWAEYAQAHLDPRIQRGVPVEETGRENIAPAAYRRMMARLEAEKAEKEAAVAQAERQIRQLQAQMDTYAAWVQEWAEFVDEVSEQFPELDVRAMPDRFPPETPGGGTAGGGPGQET